MTTKLTVPEVDRMIHKFDEFAHQVLKTHLLIEAKLDEILAQVCRSPDALTSRRFGFWEKARIIQSILGPQTQNVWVALDKFNAIRNEIAHTLDAPQKAKLIDDFSSALGLKTKGMTELKKTEEYRLETCFFGFVMLLDWLNKLDGLANHALEDTGAGAPSPQL